MKEQENINRENDIKASASGDTFYEKAQAMSEADWKKYCRIGGGLLGAVGGALLLLVPDTATFGGYKFLIVALSMLLLPRYIEGQAQRDVSAGRTAMLISFGAMLVIITAYTLITGGFN